MTAQRPRPPAGPTRPTWGDRNDLSAFDFRLAFECAPTGMMVLRQDTIVGCNRALCDLLDVAESQLLGQRFGTLFTEGADFGQVLAAVQQALRNGRRHQDTRCLRPQDAARTPSPLERQLHLQYVCLDLAQQLLICSVEDLQLQTARQVDMTPREREVALLLCLRKTSKEIGRRLAISHRTVEIYRTRLMRKYGVRNASALIPILRRELGEPSDPDEPAAQAVACAPTMTPPRPAPTSAGPGVRSRVAPPPPWGLAASLAWPAARAGCVVPA